MKHDHEIARRLEQVRREKQDLENAPVIPAVTDAVLRCQFCGAVTDHLYPLSGPVHPNGEGPPPRMACSHCHPDARAEMWNMVEEGRVPRPHPLPEVS